MATRILSWLLALLFVVSGVPKLIGVAQVVAAFEHMGYSASFRILIGVLEIAGGVALLIPAVALYGAGLLIVIMIGAVWSVLRIGESPAPPLIVGALLALLATLRLRQASSKTAA
ncbi:MAG TPA: DoxX family protein [Candidatus Kryptonia bacterium]|nr:DoxX family protein [Candidatus Kryptonia bacterium]